jgi:hypothetical protein
MFAMMAPPSFEKLKSGRQVKILVGPKIRHKLFNLCKGRIKPG